MQPMITRSKLGALAGRDGPWVTITTPLAGGGPLAKQDPIRYRNLVREAEDQLGHDERSPAIVEALRAVANDHGVFNAGSPGMVVFANPEGVELYHLPETVPERAVVDERPYFEPLLPIVTTSHHFYVVAIALHGTRLFSCDRWSARELPLPSDAPKRMEDAAGWEIEERHLQQSPASSASRGLNRGGGYPVFHGPGGGNDDPEIDNEKYVRAIAHALDRRIAHPDAPVVLACSEPIEPIFRRVTRLKDVLHPAIHGNYERASAEQVHALAWDHVAPRFEHAVDLERQRFFDLRRSGRAVDRVEEIVPAALDGRVWTLFVQRGEAQMGLFDEESRRVRLDRFDRVPIDLLERAATDTYLSGGAVHYLDAEHMPTDSPIAAILRYGIYRNANEE